MSARSTTGDARPSYLFLLPAVNNPTWNEVKSRYSVPLTAILRDLLREHVTKPKGCILDIGLPLDAIHDTESEARIEAFRPAQTLLAALYKLICVIAAKCRVQIEPPGGVDVRVFFTLSKVQDLSGSHWIEDSRVSPVIDLESIATSHRTWDHVVTVDDKLGKDLMRSFLFNHNRRIKVRHVPAGSEDEAEGHELDELEEETSHSIVAVGGTFDHLHIGHKLLLNMFAFAAEGEDRVLIAGITGDELLKNKKFREVLEDWDERQTACQIFLQAILDFRPLDASDVKINKESNDTINVVLGDLLVRFVKLHDPFGPTITEEEVSALVISAETRAGGKAINDKRTERGWEALDVFEVDIMDSDEHSGEVDLDAAILGKLSSTSIREDIVKRQKTG